ncbi:hypothetical protein OC845_001800 [Tilletia horrida]|nr:hypothetical protein OC845_001800 [Tilletia horrida]
MSVMSAILPPVDHVQPTTPTLELFDATVKVEVESAFSEKELVNQEHMGGSQNPGSSCTIM